MGPGVCVGTGLSEFLNAVSTEAKPHHFSEILMLFSLLLQFCLDETNDPDFIKNSSTEEMVFHMNDFIVLHIGDYAELLRLHERWALRVENITKIFNCFIEWLKWKTYISEHQFYLVC